VPRNEPLDDLGTCLVTGAAGFLGSHLVRALLADGYRVRGVIRNTPLELEHPRLEIVRAEVEDAKRMMEACEGIDNFHVLHGSEIELDVKLLETIPGVGKDGAASIIAEIGTNMDQFPNVHHLASWAGMCPGNNESAGKKKLIDR